MEINQQAVWTETIDSNIFKSSQSNAHYKTIKSQLVHWLVMFTQLRCRLNDKHKPVVLSCTYGFRNNYMLHSVYFRSLVDLENKNCVRVPLVKIYHQSAWCRVWIFSRLKKSPSNSLWKLFEWNCSQTIWRAFLDCHDNSDSTRGHSGNIITSGTLYTILVFQINQRPKINWVQHKFKLFLKP